MDDIQSIRPYGEKETGRPSKFTPERRAAIIQAIADRIPYEYAATANGISEETLYEWLRIGKRHYDDGIDSEYTKFSEEIKRAEYKRIKEHADNISSHVEKWQGDAWMLERRWHKHYGPNAQLNELNRELATLKEQIANEKRNAQGSNTQRSKEDGEECSS